MSSVDVQRALTAARDESGPALLALAEDQWFERKSARIKARALGDALGGFANADGGVIVIGLSAGRVEGVTSLARRLNDLMQAHIDYCVPPVRTTTTMVPCTNSAGEPDDLLVIDISPSDGAVHSNPRDEVFLRVGDETRKLGFTQRQELTFDRGGGSYEARLVSDLVFEDVRGQLLQSYGDALGARELTRLLQARGLMKRDAVTIAGCLLFAAHPQAHFPEAYIRVLRYRGSERGTGARQQLLEDHRIEGPIPYGLNAAKEIIVSLQPARRALTRSGRFEDVPLVPEDAWLEGIVNAAVHRSYSLAGDHIRVEIFDDRIEISSPGRFPGIVGGDDPLGAPRFARNPRIARVCADLNFGQELGEGIRRIYEEMQLAGLADPVYRQSESSVRLTLAAEPMDRELDAQLVPEARAITSALREAGRLSTGEVAELIGRSRPFAIQVLRSLESVGVIRWIGKSRHDPRAYWEIARP